MNLSANAQLDHRQDPAHVAQPDDNPLEIQVDQALAEYMQRCDLGEIPDRDVFLNQHPDLREQLSQLLHAADWIEKLAGPTSSDAAHLVNPSAAAGEPWSVTAAGKVVTNPNEETLPHGFPPQPVSAANDLTLPLTSSSRAAEFSIDTPVNERELTPPLLPCRFGDYVLERVLGRGGMGVVYAGHQIRLERPVAIKMIRSGALASPEEVQRFYAEARSAAKLDHPNIVTVYQCGECDGHRYFSMDYVPGTDLARMIQDGPLPGRVAARYVRDVAHAIQYAHDRGILHRDLKPANVLVDENDAVRITDFGLAKSIGVDTGLTATGAALGTPSYMSPEQASGRVDEQHHATDIYSLGAILFTLVTGEPPFKASGVVQTIMQVIHRPAPRARVLNPSVDEDMETIIDRCLHKSPERRYTSASALAEDLQRYLLGLPIHARPISRLRRSWYWLLGVPIFGAVLDNRVVEPTEAHRWFQRGLISIALLLLLVWSLLIVPTTGWFRNQLPSTVRVAAGAVGGSYDQVAQALCQALVSDATCEAIPVRSIGSSENLELLENGEVDLALLQADAVASSEVAVVAPLYYEAVHILVRRQDAIERLSQLAGKRVVLGSNKAGAFNVGRLLLARAGVELQEIQVDTTDWRALQSQTEAAAAFIVSRPGTEDLRKVLNQGNYELLSLTDSLEFALEEPSFHPLLLTRSNYPEGQLPETGINTVATTAFLATRNDTPAILVQTVLEHLYAPEMVSATGILSAERAAHWRGLPWHPAALEYFQAYQYAP